MGGVPMVSVGPDGDEDPPTEVATAPRGPGGRADPPVATSTELPPEPPTQRPAELAPGRLRRGRAGLGRVGGGGLAERQWGGRLARALGELLITAGLLVALFLGYQLWITDLFAARDQERLRSELTTSWSAGPRTDEGPESAEPEGPTVVIPVDIGDGLAVLRVPRFGADYAPVVVEGVTPEALRRGPGHFPGTALPGEIGNFVLSGHRTTYGKPFSRVDELRVGDPLVVEVADRYFTYRVTGSEIVDPDRLDVTYPVPGRSGGAPTEELMTLTTCHPKFSARSRLIVYAELDETTDKADGPPSALAGE